MPKQKIPGRTIGIVVPFPIDNNNFPLVYTDRLFEAMTEGIVRMNQEMFMNGMCPDVHPYSDSLELRYARDPHLGTVNVNGNKFDIPELWSPNMYVQLLKEEDCDSLAAYLAAWYRMRGIPASCCVYPSMVIEAQRGTNESRQVGRHVCVYVPYTAGPIYHHGPYANSDEFIRVITPDGYIEDPSVALGMRYISAGRPLPLRQSFAPYFEIDHSKVLNIKSRYELR